MSKDTIRPNTLDGFVGQADVVTTMRRAVVSARHNNRACGHLLFAGMSGCGKTTLAEIVAHEMGSRFHSAVCPAIAHKGELTGVLTQAGRFDVVFLDEIHGLKPAMQELLYTAMEDGHVDLSAGKRMIRLPLKPFTLVAATTRAHLLTGPLRDRFSYTLHLGHYSAEDLTKIATANAAGLRLAMDAEAAGEIGRRSRGTPRVAGRLVRVCRDYMQSAGLQLIDGDVARAALEAIGIDSLGLDAQDRRYLEVVCERVGAPVGVMTIATQLGIERGIVENIIEPVLMEAGLVRRTPQGRIALPAAVAHLQASALLDSKQHEVVVPEELS